MVCLKIVLSRLKMKSKGRYSEFYPSVGKVAANPSAPGGYAFSERDPGYQAAQKLYDDGKHAAAEKAFKQLVKVNQSNALKEDAMFMLGECQFQQKKYPAAQDSYDELLNEFPSTRHMSQSAQRLFQIGRFWLDFEEIVTPGEIQQVDFSQPGRQQALNSTAETEKKQKKKPLSKRYALIPEFDRWISALVRYQWSRDGSIAVCLDERPHRAVSR